jgi:hypothetical protein
MKSEAAQVDCLHGFTEPDMVAKDDVERPVMERKIFALGSTNVAKPTDVGALPRLRVEMCSEIML